MAKLETFYPIVVATPKRAGYKEYLPSVQMIEISREII